MNLDTVILWELESKTLDEESANALEDICQKIWNNRRNSPTYLTIEEDDNEQTKQRLISFDRLRAGTVKVTSRKYIGLIRSGFIQYLIMPKIYKDNCPSEISSFLSLQFKYAHSLKMPDSRDVDSGWGNVVNLFSEVQIHAFACIARELLLKRNHLAYQNVEENIHTIRGRIDFKTHIQQNIGKGRYDRIACKFELYQEDNLLLRIIKYVCRLLSKRTKNLDSRKYLAEIISLLDVVTDVPCSYKDSLVIKLNNFQQDFKQILDYCKMFLSFRMADGSSGEYGIDHVLIDTADLFERFVGGFLKNSLKEWEVQTKKGGHLIYDSQGNLFLYENDILLSHCQSGKVIIGDTKYKLIDFNSRSKHFNISHSDIYQMISYAVRRGASSILLIYPGIKNEKTNIDFSFINELSKQPITIRVIKIIMDTCDEDALLRSFTLEDIVS
jgi:5-methylcytosine-specific restriction enzyme subunit McrC